MRKIPSLYVRGADGSLTGQINPACEWVVRGEGVSTRKLDGSCCLYRFGRLWRRHQVGRETPIGFQEVDRDLVTGKVFGWVPVGDGPADQWHREGLRSNLDGSALPHAVALGMTGLDMLENTTYELLGPKVNGNAERQPIHWLAEHGRIKLDLAGAPSLDALRWWLEGKDVEGVVWWHPDGRRAKLKLRDLGLERRRA